MLAGYLWSSTLKLVDYSHRCVSLIFFLPSCFPVTFHQRRYDLNVSFFVLSLAGCYREDSDGEYRALNIIFKMQYTVSATVYTMHKD